jgi:hypothetical protein
VTARLRLLALALAGALAACGDDSAGQQGLLLSQPSDVAVFRGLTSKSSTVQPYLAIANAGSNDLTIVDARDDSMIPAPVPLRNLVFPVGQRPALLVSADLNDDAPPSEPRPDLLVAVSAGGSELQVIETWSAAGGVAATVDLGGDILAIVAIPSPQGTARVAAALSDNRIALAEFARASSGNPDAIELVTPLPVAAASIGIQAEALAALPGDQGRIWAATRDASVNGVAQISIPAMTVTPLEAGGPTRLVAAAQLAAERPFHPDGAAEPETWVTTTPVRRVYAVLDESGCGGDVGIPCGLVALDADGTGRAPDFRTLAEPRAPIPIPGRAVALAASGPPESLPASANPRDQDPNLMRISPGTGLAWTTGVAAVASSDGSLYFVDLGRWQIPSNTAARATADVVSQDASVDVSNVTSTAGFTPTERWTATYQGRLPRLVSLRVDVVSNTEIALQAEGGGGEVVRVEEAGVAVGDLVVVTDPSPLGTCAATFERRVTAVGASPSSTLEVAPGTDPDPCTSARAAASDLRAEVRAGGWVLVRGTGTSTTLAARPVGDPDVFPVAFQVTGPRIGYAPDPDPLVGDRVGPSLEFQIDPANGTTIATRDLSSVVIQTTEGRVHFRVQNAGAGARAVVPFDRSTVPGREDSGVRFFVPYASDVVLDASPSSSGGGAATLR